MKRKCVRWTEDEIAILKDYTKTNRDCCNLMPHRKYYDVLMKRRRLGIVSVSSYKETSLLGSELELIVQDKCPICNNNALFLNKETKKFLCSLCKKEFYWHELH